MLVDHDHAVNFSNWNYFAGIGNDPRNRSFKTVTQGEKYDAEGALIAQWLPALAELPGQFRHRPWLLQQRDGAQAHAVAQQGEQDVSKKQDGSAESAEALSEDVRAAAQAYPQPIVDPASQTGEGPKRKK